MTFFLLLITYPYVINRLITLPNESTIGIFFLFIFSGLFIFTELNKKERVKIPVVFKICVIIQVLVWLVYCVIWNDTSYLSRIFYIILTVLICCTLINVGALLRFIKFNNSFIAIQAVFGVLTFILVFNNILEPIVTFENIDGRSAGFYLFNCTNARLGNFIRIAGFFDEPGALAYWGVYALIFNKLFIKNKIVEFTLLVSLVFTFSAAYFIQVLVYLIVFYASQARAFISLLIVGGIAICVIVYFLGDNEQFLYMTTDRFSGGEIRSDRIYLSNLAKEYFFKSPILGNGAENLNKIAYMGDNPYEILAKDGLVGYIVTYMPLIYLAFKFFKSRNILMSCVILGLGYMQRPFHVDLMHSLILYMFVLLVIFNNSTKNGKFKKDQYCYNLL